MSTQRLRYFNLEPTVEVAKKKPLPRRTQLFAMGFNRTFTGDRRLWLAFLVAASQVGHKSLLVTTMNDTPKNRARIQTALGTYAGYVTAILFTSGVPKRQYCQLHGYKVDVWIDDIPEEVCAATRTDVRAAQKRFPTDEPVPITDEP
jgi:hypothetical protein